MTIEFPAALNVIHDQLEVVWPNGRESSCCPNDGRHYTMRGIPRPVSIGQVEAHLLYNLIVLNRVERAFEIGTGFGYSSFWLGAAMQRTNPESGWIGSLDDQSEGGLGATGIKFARAGVKHLGLDSTVEYLVGVSPADVSRHLSMPIDLAFIDGFHRNGQPRADYIGLRDWLSAKALLVWHDTQAEYDVGDGIATAMRDGWSPIVFPTSCRLCICYRQIDQWATALQAFDKANVLEII